MFICISERCRLITSGNRCEMFRLVFIIYIFHFIFLCMLGSVKVILSFANIYYFQEGEDQAVFL